jgi:Flp pilus assembly protein TadG
MSLPRPSRFLRDSSGAVAATWALALTGLIVVAGAGFDYSRLAGLDSELQNGADQAALAGATQLDGQSGACSRAAAAAASLVTNISVLAEADHTIGVATESGCDAAGNIRFFQNKEATTAATSDSNARYIAVIVDARTVDYAFTPIGGLVFGSGIQAAAVAGLGSSVCKVPPMMICSPDPGNPFNAAGKVGWGIQATGHGNTRSGPGGTVSGWGPGDFGFLEVGAGQNSDLVKALAFKTVALDCAPIDGSYPETGNPQALYDAINTRFDIYDFSSGNGTVLAPCFSGNCPAALNVVKDVVKADTSTNGNSCKIHNQGWKLPDADKQFWPKATPNGDGSYHDYSLDHPSIDAMGLPRDLCHYTSFGAACTGGADGRYGDGIWARVDYFNKNHPGGERPPNPSTVTRYQTYKWEIAQNNMPHDSSIPPTSDGDKQFGRPICSTGTADGIDRRVLTVAVVKNCSSLSGASTRVIVDEWVDLFLVEPVVDSRGNGAIADSIYMEIIGPSRLAGAGGGAAAQLIRRDVPYLVR